MKRISAVTLALFLSLTFLTVVANAQQSQNKPPRIWRINYYRILPGKQAEVREQLRKNTKPIYDEAQRQGLFLEYRILMKSDKENPADWDFAIALIFPNYAAMDTFGQKFGPINAKHYGSAEAAAAHSIELNQIREFHSRNYYEETVY